MNNICIYTKNIINFFNKIINDIIIFFNNNTYNTNDESNDESNDKIIIDNKYNIKNNVNLVNINEIIKNNNYYNHKYVITNNVAILFCIANFKGNDNDLTYPVNDAITMILELMDHNFTIFILGDNLINQSLLGKSTSLEKNGVSHEKINMFNKKMNNYNNKIYFYYAYESNLYNIINIIKTNINEPKNQNTFIYFSGHGTQTNENKIDETNSSICDINFKDISEYDIINKIIIPFNDFKNTIIIYDNCCSGGLLDSLKSYDMNNIFVMSASSYDGFGYDDDTSKHGLLTSYLLINIDMLFNKNDNSDNLFNYNKLKQMYDDICDSYIKKSESEIQIDDNYKKDYPMCYINGKLYDYTNYKS